MSILRFAGARVLSCAARGNKRAAASCAVVRGEKLVHGGGAGFREQRFRTLQVAIGSAKHQELAQGDFAGGLEATYRGRRYPAYFSGPLATVLAGAPPLP